LFIDAGVDVLRCYGFGRFVAGGVDKGIQALICLLDFIFLILAKELLGWFNYGLK